jgi:hypothetical protein
VSIVKAAYTLVPEKAPPAIIGPTNTTTAEDELYGRDTYCLDALRPGRWARGKQLLAQRLYHRLITPRGSLRGGDQEANFGYDLAGKIGSTDARTLASMLPVQIQNELGKDEEVDAVKVTATSSTNAGQVSWSITISVTPNTVGPFDLVLAASAVTVELLGVR